ncbi:T9SS type A sorting domain-containing protein [Candidatus Kapabacteria bacterium]|nr:T9SS type A sorting domain-containing protein [Candidatus Kapabacteria bacterium]
MFKISILLLVITGFLNSQEKYSESVQEVVNWVEEQEGKPIHEVARYKPIKRWLHKWGNRIHDEEFPDVPALFEIVKQEKSKSNSNNLLTLDKVWKSVGPVKPPNEYGVGRVNRIKFHPNDPSTIFIATAGGGVWKSTNSGNNWFILPTSDFLSMSYSDLVISPSNPNVIYLASGDANAGFLNGNYYSVGVLKSIDGGKTFEITNLNYELADGVLTSSILVDPTNPDIVIVGTSEGMYKSTDGGDSWLETSNKPIKDLEFLPNDKNVVLASTYNRNGSAEILRSTDQGDTWTSVFGLNQAIRIELATSPNHSDYIAAVASEVRPYNFLALAISENGGESFEIVADKSDSPNIISRGDYPDNVDDTDQGWYDMCISISPNDKDSIYVGGLETWVTGNAGETWDMLDINIHVDQHYSIVSPNGNTLYLANDGGFYAMDRELTLTEMRSDDLNISQFYKCDLSTDLRYKIGGTQDNATFVNDRESNNWLRVLSGDGMDCHIDPENVRNWYGSSQYGFFRYSRNAGQDWRQLLSTFRIRSDFEIEETGAWVTPMDIDPINSENIYIGYTDIYKNTNYGEREDWERVSDFNSSSPMLYLEVSEKNPDYILAGFATAMFLSKDGGENWQNVIIPISNLSNVTFHPEDETIFYATASNFRGGLKVYKNENNEWTNISGNLPNVPVNVIKYQKDSPERLYVGTDLGVYFTDYGSNFWERFGSELPFTIVNDIEIDEEQNILLAATYGRGMWENELIYCDNPTFSIIANGETEFCEGKSVTLSIENPSSSVQYLWSNNEVGTEIEVNSAGSYSAKIIGSDCTSKSNPISTNVINVQEIEISAARDTICIGDSIRVNASFGFKDYQWSDGKTGFTRFINEPGTYSLVGTLSNGCESFTEITIYEANPDIPSVINNSNTLSSDLSSSADYQWYLDGNPIDDSNSRSFTAKVSGDYSVEITSNFGCIVKSEEEAVIIASLEISENKFEIIPNPNNGQFELRSDYFNNDFYQLSILNLQGQVIFNKNNLLLSENNNQINLKAISSGVYFIKLQSENNTFVKKIIIE